MHTKKQKKVLVIEDEAPLLQAIKKKLETAGFGVITARSVDEALPYLEHEPADAIWLDHYLLGARTGLDVVVQIKNHAAWKDVPIFVVSNTASPDKVSSYLHLGVNKYYTKADFRLDQIIADVIQAT